MDKVETIHNNLKRRGRGNVIAILLTILFAAYYSGSTLFVHTHFIGLGRGTVTHSHPYLPDNHHSHSANEFDALASLDDITTEEIEFTTLPSENEVLLNIFIVQPVSIGSPVDQLSAGSRAPPVRFM